MKKIKYDGRVYRKRLFETLIVFCPGIYDCIKCGSPKIKGYCCTYCGCGCASKCECKP